ncbi:hypothetical protein TKK_0006865 [Trichogramma kaykai]|uniref:Acyl-CoA dehydrogenase family member 9, mitochondrial n=1 Tax=Trichogramma kaykai TaxID=54128 RepID=A0ABD2XA29_9HYME
MLVLRALSKRQLSNVKNSAACYQARKLTAQTNAKTAEPKSDLTKDFQTSKLPAALPKKPKREPFAKNLFIGEFDYNFLTYPEPQHVDRYNEFEELFSPIRAYLESLNPEEFEDGIPPHVLQKLREFKIFGARISEDYQGINLLDSEYIKVLEAAGKVPTLGIFLLKQGVPAINLFNKYGTVEQKFKYLPKIATGQVIPTIAVTEKNSGPAAKHFMTTASLTLDDKQWVLDGEKTFVANGLVADVFIVFAHAFQGGTMEKRPETISAFIVDKNTKGVQVVPDSETVGLKGYTTGKLIMKNVHIPSENILGEVGNGAQQLVENFSENRHYIGAIMIAILKDLLNKLTEDNIHRKHFNCMFYETESAQYVFTKLMGAIYAMESVLYLTTSLQDMYENPDVILEMAVTEKFCVQECLNLLQESLWLAGPKATLLIHPYERILRDVYSLTYSEISLIDTNIYSGLLGVQNCGKAYAEGIKKARNPLLFPVDMIKKHFFDTNHLNLHLEEYLHPSLQECADFCDRCILKLQECTQEILIRHGTEVGKKHMDMQRLSDMVSQIYAYVAVVGRASRSYCIGNRNSDAEIKLCMVLAYRMQQRVFQLAEDIKNSEFSNGDHLSRELSKIHFEQKKYIFENPLQRNY